MNANLILHCGGQKVAREEIAQVLTPQPEKTWHPISHESLIQQVEKALSALQMRIVTEAHSLANGGNRYFGLLQVANCRSPGNDFAYVLGLRNSHDKAFCAGLVVGSQVLVCDNLSFSGEITIARKHTTFIERDLPVLTGRAVSQLSNSWTSMAGRIETYKRFELSDRDAHDFVVRSLDVGACTLLQVPHILKEWRAPRHPEFAQNKTAWRLFNSYTEAAKGSGLDNIRKRTITLHGLMDSQVGFKSIADEIAPGASDTEVNVAALN
jgi:hypothetical protein